MTNLFNQNQKAMKTFKFLFVLCIMLAFAVSASSQGMDKQVVKPMKGSFYAVDVPPYGNPQLLALSGNATHLGNFSGEMLFLSRLPILLMLQENL